MGSQTYDVWANDAWYQRPEAKLDLLTDQAVKDSVEEEIKVNPFDGTPRKPATSAISELDATRKKAAEQPIFIQVIDSCLFTDPNWLDFFHKLTATQNLDRISEDIGRYLKNHPDQHRTANAFELWIKGEGNKFETKDIQSMPIEMIENMLKIVKDSYLYISNQSLDTDHFPEIR